MITVPNPISPQVTDFQGQASRVRMRSNGHSKKVRELREKKAAGQNNVNDREARIAMVLAGDDFPAASDIDAQIATELLNWEATDEAEQSLKPKIAAAKHEAGTAVLAGLKKPHDEVVQRIVGPLSQLAHAWVELFQLSRDLKDKEIGWRNGVCDLVPALVESFGPPILASQLANLLHEAVKLGYLESSVLPKELRG
jgi:hypothetical protein